MKKLGFLIVVLSGVIGLLANASQIFAYIETHPGFLKFWLKSVPDPAIQRPADIVFIIENVGGVLETNQIDSLSDPLNKRLSRGDTLSVIVFTESGSQFIMERQTGESLSDTLSGKLRHLIPVKQSSKQLMDDAYFKARDFLNVNRDPTRAAAIMVISSKTTDETLNRYFNRIRTGPVGTLFKFGTRAGEGNVVSKSE